MKAHEQEMNSVGTATNFILGALIGGLIGMIAGLWFAPQSGKEAQRKLRKEGIRLRQQLGDSVDGVRAELEHAADSAQNTAQTAVQETANKVERVVQNGQQAAYNSFESIAQAVNQAQQSSR